jgi:hypothetical protein
MKLGLMLLFPNHEIGINGGEKTKMAGEKTEMAGEKLFTYEILSIIK